MEETIGNEKLYPNLLMYVNFEEEFSGLDEDKIKGIKQDLHLLDLDEEEEINNYEKKEEDKNEIMQNEIIMEDEKEKNNN